MSSTALTKTIATAVAKQTTNKVVGQAVAKAVKAAAPLATQAALKAWRSSGKPRPTPTKPTNTTSNAKRFAPVAYSTSFTNSGNPIRITQSEIVATISPATKNVGWWPFNHEEIMDYTCLTLPINPANITTFPWLSQIAGLFDKYRFRKLSFTFVSTKPTNTKGNIAMAYDFDAYDACPANMVDMSNLAKFCTTPVYVNKTIDMPINHPGNQSWYYCADGSNGDLKTYNVGKFYLALVGAADMNMHGYVVANYDIELVDKNPKLTTVKTIVNPDTGVASYTIYQDEDDPSPDGPSWWSINCLQGASDNKSNLLTTTLTSGQEAFFTMLTTPGDTVCIGMHIRNISSITPGNLHARASGFSDYIAYITGNVESGGILFLKGVANQDHISVTLPVVCTSNTSTNHVCSTFMAS